MARKPFPLERLFDASDSLNASSEQAVEKKRPGSCGRAATRGGDCGGQGWLGAAVGSKTTPTEDGS
jgi:hypothetical protein